MRKGFTAMSRHSILVKAGLAVAISFAAISYSQAACAGPPALQARITAHPGDAQAYADLGNWFGGHNQYACAVEAFQKALKLEPGSAKFSYLLGLSLFSADRVEESIVPLQQSIQLMPEVLKPHLILATALFQLQRRDEAKAEFEAVLRIDPHSTVALNALGKYLIAEGNYGGAVALLRSAPPDENMTVDLALAYDKMEMLDDATTILTRWLHSHPSSLSVTSALTDILVSQGRYQDAVVLTGGNLCGRTPATWTRNGFTCGCSCSTEI